MAEESFGSRLKNAWNVFVGKVKPESETPNFMNTPQISYHGGHSYRPDRSRVIRNDDKTIITAIFNRIAVDASSISIKHVMLDENLRYEKDMDSKLNEILQVSANIDQTGRALIHDLVLSMLDEGVVAIVPVDFDNIPEKPLAECIDSIRVGKIIQWYPDKVRVRLYNEINGINEEVTVLKKSVAIVENPLYAVINEPNSTAQRLINKLKMLDYVDQQTMSGKLDLIIKLPYTIRSEARRQQAEVRRKDIEAQLAGSKYGIAYVDGTEDIVQLNRSLDNNLLKQIESLTSMLYSQLGMTKEILEGSATEQVMLNYNNRTLEPILSSIVDEFIRKFLTSEARKNRQSIKFFIDPFRLVPANSMAEMADKFTRNEIMSSNEIRQILGLKPSSDPKADELVNSNISQSKEEIQERLNPEKKTEHTEKHGG